MILCFLIFVVSGSAGQSGKLPSSPKKRASTVKEGKAYLVVPARSGDDLPAFLQRYGLYDYECNITQFFEINGLKEDYRLKAGVSYKLPIEVTTYNGKSIRSTLGITDWRAAKRIEAYNKFALKEGLRTDDFMETKRLWVPWHELKCPSEGKVVVASASVESDNAGEENTLVKGSRSYAIFGKKYARTPFISQKLKGKVFYIVSGHGGPDPGAQGRRAGRTLCEDEYAYDVCLRLVRLLVSHGATVYPIVRDANDGIRDDAILLCDQDEKVWGDLVIPRDQKERLQQRCDVINGFTAKNAKAGENQTLIEIHVDSRSNSTKKDVFFYFRPGSEPSRKLALHMQNTFMQKYLKKRNQRGYEGSVSARNLYMLKETTTPKAVFIELGNIRNDWDQQRLVLKNNRQALANWLCDALISQ